MTREAIRRMSDGLRAILPAVASTSSRPSRKGAVTSTVGRTTAWDMILRIARPKVETRIGREITRMRGYLGNDYFWLLFVETIARLRARSDGSNLSVS